MEDSFSEIEKRKILAILGDNNDLITMTTAKIYTTNITNKNWLYSGLEGFFCFILDFKEKTKNFIVYDLNTFECLFKFELYTNFENFYKILSDDFHCFETDKGFIGLAFYNLSEAAIFEKCIRKYDDNLTNQFFKKNINRKKDKYKKGKEYLSVLKEKFVENFNKMGEIQIDNLANKIKLLDFEDYDNSILDLEICKPRYYEILLQISYDKEKKLFNLQKIPSHVKKLFKKIGIKKKDFKNESLALHIFKFFMKFFDELQLNKKLKTQNLEKIGNKKLSILNDNPEELLKTIQKYSENEINKIKTFSIPIPPKLPFIPIIPSNLNLNIGITNLSNVPSIPTFNPPISNEYGLKGSISSNISDINKDSIESSNKTNEFKERESIVSSNALLEEFKKGKLQLKKIENKPQEENRKINLKKDEEKIMQTSLMEAIKLRRVELTKNDLDSDKESDSDWSD